MRIMISSADNPNFLVVLGYCAECLIWQAGVSQRETIEEKAIELIKEVIEGLWSQKKK